MKAGQKSKKFIVEQNSDMDYRCIRFVPADFSQCTPRFFLSELKDMKIWHDMNAKDPSIFKSNYLFPDVIMSVGNQSDQHRLDSL